MSLEKLGSDGRRLLLVCTVVSLVSLFVGVKYYFLAFPEASIEFRVTKQGSVPIASGFLSRLHLDPKSYRHAAIFVFDDEQKTFLERELGVAQANRLLETTVRLWRWRHRWFRPLQKEEMTVEVTTKGEVVGFSHLLAEDAGGANLAPDQARRIAEGFLVSTMARPLETLSFVEGSTQKRPHRTDHSFTWKVVGSEVHGAEYRVAVDVAGAAVAGYRELLRVPDTWVRGYEKLRSKNEVTNLVDSVFLLLTVLAMLVFLVLRVRRGDVRWKAAATLGGVTFVLITLSELNSLPSELIDYDTTASFAGFLVGRIFLALAAGLATGVLILLLTASGEPLYRERFPSRLSLSSLLRPRSLWTREFFVSALVGVTLTCFFFAYENVFYIIANALGAWAPREVAYSDLLSTAIPWIYVLFFGFLPAISEEFISRMFSIPFFEKLLRSTAVAIVLSAFIWGFGHAGYPNQPFWIRGLEVGLAGIIFGLAFLRFGIGAVVICHFSVDALYTAFVLIRSPNLYYQISGSLSAGVFLVLLLVAAVAYRLRGGFLPAEVTNAVEGTAPPPEPRARAAAVAVPDVGYRPLSARRVAWGLALAAAFAALAFLPVQRFGDWVALRATRSSARVAAEAFLRRSGFDVSKYRKATWMMDRTDTTAAAYLLRVGGLPAASKVYAELAPTPLWRVRFFVPGQKEEYAVSIDANRAVATGFRRELLDDAPGARFPKERALALAVAFLRSNGVDPARGELKEQKQKDEKARRDHTLVWEFPVPAAGEAKVRHEVVVQGGAVGSWAREVKIPEQWRREREKETALTVVLRFLKLPFTGLLGALAVVLLVAKLRAGEIPWRTACLLGGVVAAAVVLRVVVSLDTLWSQYQTSIPAEMYDIVIVVGFVVAALGGFVGATLAGGLAAALHPAALSMLRPAPRRLFARDAMVGAALALGLVLGLPMLHDVLPLILPAGRLINGVDWPNGIEASLPALFILAGAVSTTVYLPALGGIVAAVLLLYFRRAPARVALAVFFVLSFLPREARTAAEYALAALWLVLVAGAVLLLARGFLRDNPLAWLTAAWVGVGGAGALQLLAEPGGAYRLDGILALAAILAPVVWLLAAALPRAPSELSSTATS